MRSDKRLWRVEAVQVAGYLSPFALEPDKSGAAQSKALQSLGSVRKATSIRGLSSADIEICQFSFGDNQMNKASATCQCTRSGFPPEAKLREGGSCVSPSKTLLNGNILQQ